MRHPLEHVTMAASRRPRSVACLVSVLFLGASTGAAWGQSAVPDHLSIVSAGIAQLPSPGAATDLAAIEVRLRIRVAGIPPCKTDSRGLAYGFVIDADKNATTGYVDPFFADLGIDARITVECQVATGRLGSPIGDVTVESDPSGGPTTIDLYTVAGLLPSLDFYWIAYATEGGQLVRLPDAPDSVRWAPMTILLF